MSNTLPRLALWITVMLGLVLSVSPRPSSAEGNPQAPETAIHGAPSRLELTGQERAWLRAHPVIRLGIDRDFAPYEWIDPAGNYVGMVADFMRLIEQRLGVKFAIAQDKSWLETLEMARRGELDMIGAAVRTADREQYLSFTAPYVTNPAIIVNDDRHGYTGTLKRLAGKRVAIEEGYFVQELLAREYPAIQLVAAGNVHQALMMVLAGQADAYVGDAVSASHAIKQAGLMHLGFSGQTPYQSQSSIAVSKRSPELFAIIGKALASIPQSERDAIINHWMGLKIEQGIKAEELLGYGAAVSLLFLLFTYWIYRLRREVKARQRSEAALRKSETRLSLAQSAAHIGIWDWDMLHNRATFSPEYYELFGLPEGTPHGYEDFLSMVHPEDRGRVDAKVRQSSTEEPHLYAVEYRVTRTTDGAIRWLVSKGRFFCEQGRPLRAMGVVYDITERKRTEQALLDHEQKFRQLFDNMSSGAAIYQAVEEGKDFVFVDANKAAGRIERLPTQTLIGRRVAEVFPGIGEFGLLAVLERVWRSGRAERFPLAHYQDSRVSGWRDNYVFRLDNGLVVVIYDDLTEQMRTEEKLRLTARVFDTTLESVIITDAGSKLIDVNPAFSSITGYSHEEVLGKNPRFLKSGLHGAEFYQAMWQAIGHKGHWSGEIWNRKKNGEIFPEWLTISALTDERGHLTHYVGIGSDISLLKQHEKQLEHIAHYDALTGIPNRVLLADRMKQAIAHALRHQQLIGVCYLDLDGFKPINDSFGHEAGDWVLIETSRRIASTLRSADTVARLGGDEFAILLLELKDAEECEATVKRLLDAIAEPLAVADKVFMITASVGVTLFPDDNHDPDTLLRHADQAMYIAKQSGKNHHHLYDAERDRRARVLSEYLAQIRQGIENGEFVLFYQPKVHMGDGRLVGAEALIRWRNPRRGLLAPTEFLPFLENSDLENTLGEWVIDTALAQLEAWRLAGLAIEVSVNIAAGHLQSEDFLRRLRGKLAAHPELPRGVLQIEILESVALADIPKMAKTIESCAEMGVKFALDDFGTGYSSLAYLRRLPAETLKIDQSFVRDMLTDEADRAIIQGVIALARVFGRKIVAEGVETAGHCRALLEMGCDIGQGYGIARPMPAEEFAQWRKGRR